MFCNKCGQQNPDGSAVCSSCGNALAVQQQNVAPQTHNVPKCTCCGHVGEMKPGPLFRTSDIIWIALLLCLAGAGFFYLIFILIMRGNPEKREKICPNCKAQNMFTYVY